MSRRLGLLLDVRRGEGWTVVLLLAQAYFIGASTALFETVGETLFLLQHGVERLAWVYIGWAVAVPLAGLAYTKLQNRFHISEVWLATVAMATLVNLVTAAGLAVTSDAWISFAMMVCRDVFWALLLMQFWDLAGFLLDLQQAKRLFGLIGAGEVAGGITAGLMVGPLMHSFSAAWVVAFSALGYLLCLGVLMVLLRLRRARVRGETGNDQVAPPIGLRTLVRERYVVLLLGLPVVYTLAYDFLEYAYLGQVAQRFQGDAAGLAAFLGGVLVCWQTLTLLLRAAVTGRLLTRFGIWVGLSMLPMAMLLTSTALLVFALTMPQALFWAVVLTKVVDAVVRNAVDKHAFLVLFQVLARDLRVRVHTFQESVAEPLTAGISGVALLALTALVADQSPALSVAAVALLILIITAGWLLLVRRLRPAYDDRLRRALGGHSLLQLRANTATLEQGIALPEAKLDADVDAPDLHGDLLDQLCHPDHDTAQAALRRLSALGVLPMDAEREFAARVLAGAGGDVVALLDSTLAECCAARRPQARAVARALGRIRAPAAEQALLRHLAAPLPEVRWEVARALALQEVRIAGEDAKRLIGCLRLEVRSAGELYGARLALDEGNLGELAHALDWQVARQLDICFALLSLLYCRESVQLAALHLGAADPEHRAYAVEIIHSLCPRGLSRVLQPLIDALPAQERRLQLARIFLLPERSREDWLRILACGEVPWVATRTRVAALRHAGEKAVAAVRVETERATGDPHPHVRQAAAWALARLPQG